MKIYLGTLTRLKIVRVLDDAPFPTGPNVVHYGPIQPESTYIYFEQQDESFVALRIDQRDFTLLKEAVDMLHATRTLGKGPQ